MLLFTTSIKYRWGRMDSIRFSIRRCAAFSEMHITPLDAIAEGDLVCLRSRCGMRHVGDGLGMPATNKRLEITSMSIVRVANGKIAAGWQNWDMLGLMQRINAGPMAATYLAAVG